jgi:hypothetical protein
MTCGYLVADRNNLRMLTSQALLLISMAAFLKIFLRLRLTRTSLAMNTTINSSPRRDGCIEPRRMVWLGTIVTGTWLAWCFFCCEFHQLSSSAHIKQLFSVSICSILEAMSYNPLLLHAFFICYTNFVYCFSFTGLDEI